MIYIDGNSLTIEDIVKIARFRERIALTEESKIAINKSRAIVEKVLQEEKFAYGISTGFGDFSKIFIDKDQRQKLQRNLILSHSAGVGDVLSEDVVRAAMLLRINSLSKGYSGIRLSTVEKLIELLNKDIYPFVPCKGSVGASGDLVPLSHIALAMLGEGEVFVNGKLVPAKEAMDKAGISTIELAGKEGLALNNGTQVMTAIGALVWYDAANLMKISDIAASLSLEALKGTRTSFDNRIAQIRPHKGQIATAENVLKLTEDSSIIASHANCDKVQDAYSLRCVSQVHGASKDALRRIYEALDVEINSVTDNPLIMPETGEIISGGNFHGQPIALVMDYIKLAIAEIGDISERRINRLVDPHLSDLPPFLTAYPGIDSGFMIAQFVAASLVSENKVLAHPACVDSIPTSANQEDHVSMGTIAARQSREMLENVRNVLAIELLAAAQGIDFLDPLKPGIGTSAAHDFIRKNVPHLEEDRILYIDIKKIYDIISNGSLLNEVEEAVGKIACI